MPYEWRANRPEQPINDPQHLRLWPYRSLPRKGFVVFIAVTAAFLTLPLIAVLGSVVLWGLLPFFVAAVTGVWWALQRNYRDAEIVEHLTVWPDRMTLVRIGPKAQRQTWQANPHWVRVQIYPTGGRVPNYVTLQGGPREVELGAFLSEDERLALVPELEKVLSRLR